MIFLGYSFMGDTHSLSTSTVGLTTINTITLTNGVIDILKIDNSAEKSYSDTWDYNTIALAKFENNLLAGNITYTIDSLSSIKVKRRVKGTFGWLTLAEYPVIDESSLSFIFNDITAASKQQYEYALVPIMTGDYGIEGTYNINEISTNFPGNWICENGLLYNATFNADLSTTRNFTTSVTSTLYRKYPFVHKLGKSNYISGNLKATFIQYENCIFNFENGVAYRDNVQEFLTNGKPKLIKVFDGREWLVGITGNLEMDESGDYRAPLYSFDFTEVGNPTNNKDLYEAGIIDVRSNN